MNHPINDWKSSHVTPPRRLRRFSDRRVLAVRSSIRARQRQHVQSLVDDALQGGHDIRARAGAANALAQIRLALGRWERFSGLLRVADYVASAADSLKQPAVLTARPSFSCGFWVRLSGPMHALHSTPRAHRSTHRSSSRSPSRGRQVPGARDTNETKWPAGEVYLTHLPTRLNATSASRGFECQPHNPRTTRKRR